MQTRIIHCARRTDRIKNIASLIHHFPKADIYPAKEPRHEATQHNKAMLGCALSHLDLIGKSDGTVLVLEDDATLEGEMPDLSTLPDDAAAILLGGEAYTYGEDENGWREIFPKYFGTQAIIYTAKAKECLKEAYRVIAESGLGRQEGASRICFESLLMNAGMKIYRPSGEIPFSTLEDLSETRGQVLPPRKRDGEAVDKEPLVSWDKWKEYFRSWTGKEIWIEPAENAAEDLKMAATKQLLNHFGIDLRKGADLSVTLDQLPHDLALAYRTSLKPDRKGGEGIFFRADEGQTIRPGDNMGDPAIVAPDRYRYLMMAGTHEVVRTNRLSFAIAALIMEVPKVILYESAFGNNRKIFEESLEELGCEWGAVK